MIFDAETFRNGFVNTFQLLSDILFKCKNHQERDTTEAEKEKQKKSPN